MDILQAKVKSAESFISNLFFTEIIFTIYKTIYQIPIPPSANLDCSYDPFNSLVGARGIGLHLDEELPFLVHVIANDRGQKNPISVKF